jgi:outer membrane protein TolC
MVTTYDPALTFTNPRFGEDAALSEFDANLSSRLFFQKNDRPFNNQLTGDVEGRFQQDLLTYDVALSKRAATGTIFTLRNLVDYDANSEASNRYPSAWQSIIESEFRHPLLQGSGVFFNRIAGPSTQAGVYNGILIARINSEISLTRFEQGVRDLISNVENAYWDLYFAYRELDAQTEARDEAFRLYEEKSSAVGRVSSLEIESAKEQYLRFQNNIVASLEGRLIEGTRTDNGSLAGSFRGTIGVRAAERRLRYLLGMPITDGSLLTPADLPTHASVVFDWNESIETAMNRRPERREQLWALKQRQLELTAARNFLLPRLDFVGTYRFRGLGDDLTGGSNTFNDDVNAGTSDSNAWGDLLSGDFQEWQLGGELSVPIGYRRGHSAVRHAELAVARERALLKEQERAITLGISNAVGELRRAYVSMELAKERYQAAINYSLQANEREKTGASTIDVLLEAQRRVLESRLEFLRAEVEFMLAIKNVHFERGTLLDYNQVYLTEEESELAAQSTAVRFSRRGRSINYSLQNPTIGQPATEPSNRSQLGNEFGLNSVTGDLSPAASVVSQSAPSSNQLTSWPVVGAASVQAPSSTLATNEDSSPLPSAPSTSPDAFSIPVAPRIVLTDERPPTPPTAASSPLVPR